MKKPLFKNRDLSWLSFNYRVLQEAKDPRVPLYERIKFLAIYSSNLDEFFRVRVAGIRSLIKINKSAQKELEFDPAELLKKVNRILVSDLPGSRFITLIYAVIDPQTRSINLASAGHTPPVLSSKTGASFLQVNSGLPLGIKEFDYAETNFIMKKGEKLFLYSDGVTEAFNPEGDMYGDERFIQLLSESKNLSVKALLDVIDADLNKFRNNLPLGDDTTLVSLKRNLTDKSKRES